MSPGPVLWMLFERGKTNDFHSGKVKSPERVTTEALPDR